MSMYSTRYKYSNRSGSQDFGTIKAQCLRSRSLFEDPEFPANNLSIYGASGKGQLANRTWAGSIYWKRPVELTQNPQFIANGVSRFDVIQGELGNCWFIAAVANLTMHPGLFTTVIPYQSNGFQSEEYCGAFQFRFWQYGTWVTIVVDDRLPCDRYGELLFLHSSDKREFWSALLEKAYAKFHGSYSSLVGGSPGEALQDFSGGIIEMIDLEESGMVTDLFYTLRKAYDRSSLITCALSRRSGGYFEEKTRQGLVRGHAYSITGVQQIRLASSSSVQLVRVRNPWGDHFEWNGPWSDRSREWNLVDPATKAAIGVTHQNDGEFWMDVQDFQRQFTRIDICHISPDPIDSNVSKMFKRPWNKEIVEGSWVPGFSAGGCFNYRSFGSNPQYFFHFEASDEDGSPDKCTVVISLIQRMGKRFSSVGGRPAPATIGFRMFKVNALYRDGTKLDLITLKQSSKSYNSGAFTDTREVSARFEVPSGNYCIVPSTYEPEIEGDFLLRVFSEPSSSVGGQPAAMPYLQQTQTYFNNSNQSLSAGLQNMNISSSGNTGSCPYPVYSNSAPPSVPSFPAPTPIIAYPSSSPAPPFPAYPVATPFPSAPPVTYPNPTSYTYSSATTPASCPYPAVPCYSSYAPVFGAPTPFPTVSPLGAMHMPMPSPSSAASTPYPPNPSYNNATRHLPYPT